MSRDEEQILASNRERKMAGRGKRRRYVQGTRAYTHAMTNSMAKRVVGKARKGETTTERQGDQ